MSQCSQCEAVKDAISDLTRELWGNPHEPPDWHAEWSQDEMQRLVRKLARVAGVPVPEWAGGSDDE